MNSSSIIGAIEIGTSKIVVLIAELHAGNSMTIIGKAECSCNGMKRGEIVHLDQISNYAHTAILAAEKQADARIQRMYLSMTGAHLKGFRHPGTTTINSSGGLVTERDLDRAVQNSKGKALQQGYSYLLHALNGYLLDGRPVDNPLGKAGSNLEVSYWHVIGDQKPIREHLQVINGFGLDVGDIIISSVASGSLLASDAEKRVGVLVVDIGKGTTDYVLYRAGRVIQTGVIPVGGEHITNDLSLGLRTKPKYAERLKLRAARAVISKNDRIDKVPLIGDLVVGDSLVSQLCINKITHARLEELFMILKNRLGSHLSRANLPAGVILTGGVAKTPAIAELAEITLDVPVTLGRMPNWVNEGLRDPEYATVLGLIYNASRHEHVEEAVADRERGSGGWLKRMSGIFAGKE